MFKHTGYKLISITILYKISSSRISLIFIFHKILSVSKIKKGGGSNRRRNKTDRRNPRRSMTRIPRVSRGERERENRDGVNRAYANPVEALRASGTCRTLLILNTCSLVLAGSTPTRGEWSLYGIPLPLSLSLPPLRPSFYSWPFLSRTQSRLWNRPCCAYRALCPTFRTGHFWSALVSFRRFLNRSSYVYVKERKREREFFLVFSTLR